MTTALLCYCALAPVVLRLLWAIACNKPHKGA